MKKNSANFKCVNCGNVSSKWTGKCQSCLEWNTLQEIKAIDRATYDLAMEQSFSLSEPKVDTKRIKTLLNEFDIVLGGGLVPGASVLIGGEPGIGKSTLLMQIADMIARNNELVHYYSGEESKLQVLLRASRLEISNENIQVYTHSNLEEIKHNIEQLTPKLVIVDSIQTSHSVKVDGTIGSINQVKYTCSELIETCKKFDISLLLVGHITKDGQLAGPKTIEHMVDTVLYFESDKGNDLRLIRTAKNRYGSTSEIGIFKMLEKGLEEVSRPSSLFLSSTDSDLNGTSIFPAIEGSRIILLEIQSLVTKSPFSTAKRTVVGWDSARLSMILAVLESRCNLTFSNLDIYLNIAGGVKTYDPAADLAVAASLISSKLNFKLDAKIGIFGEINLSGTIRESNKTEARLNEIQKLGFKKAIISKNAKFPVVNKIGIEKIGDMVEFVSRLKDLRAKI